MACGTPVIAYRCGSVPEVLEDGLTGFVVDDLAGAIGAIDQLHRLDRRVIRAQFERRFTAERMARDYVAVYESLSSVLELPRAGARPAVGATLQPRVAASAKLGRVTAA
jgi:Glycosyl transferases group 1